MTHDERKRAIKDNLRVAHNCLQAAQRLVYNQDDEDRETFGRVLPLFQTLALNGLQNRCIKLLIWLETKRY